MLRAFALLVAFIYIVPGTHLLLVFVAGTAMGGARRSDLLVLAGITVYIYGVAAAALWYAVKPFPHGATTLVALLSPVVLIILLNAGYLAWGKSSDLARVAAAEKAWEEWASPPDVFGIPVLFDGKPLVATRSGIVESNDDGRSWTPVGETFDEWPVVTLWAQVDHALFAALSSGRLYRSEDGGASWTLLGVPWAKDGTVYWTESGLPRSETITALVPSGPDLYLHTYGYIFRSEDLGESWIMAYQGEGARERAQATSAMSLAVSGGTVLVGTFRSGVYRSNDGGTSWLHLDGFPHPNVPSLATDGRSYYAIAHGDVLRSTSDGDTWEPVNRGLDGPPRELVGAAGTTMFVLTERGVFAMESRDTIWTAVPMPGPTEYVPPPQVGNSFGVSGEHLFVLNPDQHIYRLRTH